jgi:hypothetical protein
MCNVTAVKGHFNSMTDTGSKKNMLGTCKDFIEAINLRSVQRLERGSFNILQFLPKMKHVRNYPVSLYQIVEFRTI